MIVDAHKMDNATMKPQLVFVILDSKEANANILLKNMKAFQTFLTILLKD